MITNILSPPDSSEQIRLTDFSPIDKPWDTHAGERDQVRNLYLESGHVYARRMTDCSQWLDFALTSTDSDEVAFKLQSSKFCRVRHCPVCQWRRSLKWRAKFFQVLPQIRETYPTARFIFLTLTVKNCELADLRSQITIMNQAWGRLVKRKNFPALGWVRSLEVTKSKDGSAHPHFHSLLMVPTGYFTDGYLNQSEWSDLWQSALKINYTPIVDVRIVKPKPGVEGDGIAAAVCETLKYSVKPDDLVSNAPWLLGLTKQLHKTRAVAVGGVLKQYLADLEKEPDDLIHVDETSQATEELGRLRFDWRYEKKQYTT
jgi:plasmid rolling circle replication initiator protein Rep